MLRILHDAVKGRVRYKVRGLYRSEELKVRLIALGLKHGEITQIVPNTLTGNALVHYDPRCNPRVITAILENCVLQFVRESQVCGGCTSRYPQGFSGEKSSSSAASGGGDRSQEKPKAALLQRQDSDAWHRMSPQTVVQRLSTSARSGLSPADVENSRHRFGPNFVPDSPPRSDFQIFVEQFHSLPVALLVGAAVLSAVTGGLLDACVVMAVVGINAVIGFVTEREAERTIHALKQLVSGSAQVVREGILQEVAADEVVVGDILLLKPGTRVAADARVIHAHELTVDESVLTGESMPVRKIKEALRKTDIALADRLNMVYSGTLVVGGAGTGVVVAVGASSEIGKIKNLVSEIETPPTLIERQLEGLGNKLVLISAALCILFFLFGFLYGRGFIEMLKTSIALAVAAVPEGLPAVATTTLALGVKRLRRDKVIIRNLDAICTLGSVQTICFDKTGTITYNRMSVTSMCCGDMMVQIKDGIFAADGHPVDLFSTDPLMMMVRVSVLCNESKIEHHNGGYVVTGSPTENALIHMAMQSGIDVVALREQHPLISIQYRSENRNFMETTHVWDGSKTLFAVKGNPSEVLSMCSRHYRDGELIPFSEEDRDAIEYQNDNMAGDGLRVLGIGYRISEPNAGLKGDHDLVWLGLIGMADPIREQAKQSIRRFHRAGLETVMITGDQAATAYAVGKELGLSNGNPLEVLDSRALRYGPVSSQSPGVPCSCFFTSESRQ